MTVESNTHTAKVVYWAVGSVTPCWLMLD